MATANNLSVGIFIVAYNAENTINTVLSRIRASAWDIIDEVFIFDDASHDKTVDMSNAYEGKHQDKISIFSNQINLGYGGNQKRGYRYARKREHDIVVLLHGDGQYAPECLEEIIAPLISGKAQAVFGSRMINKKSAFKGGMPLYKYVGNKVLSTFQNLLLPGHLSEYHSGYRAYHVPSLNKLPIMENSNDFHFDTEIIIQLMEARMTIEEVPIPTYYGDEICHVNGVKYAWEVFKATLSYKFHRAGLRLDPRYHMGTGDKYTYKKNKFSSHERIVSMVKNKNDQNVNKILDIGCGSGRLAAKLAKDNNQIIGIDIYDNEEAKEICDKFIVANIENGMSEIEDKDFDIMVFADILEHVTNPEKLLLEASQKLTEKGKVVASSGNVAHIVIRLMLLLGRFEYTDRGILDRGHVRLFTNGSFKQLFKHCSFKITNVRYCPIPFENIFTGYPKTTDFLSWLNMGLVKMLPSLFAYQIVIEAEPCLDNPSDLLRQQQIMGQFKQVLEKNNE